MKKLILLIITLSLFIATPVMAEPESHYSSVLGSELQIMCEEASRYYGGYISADEVLTKECYKYISGVVDSHTAFHIKKGFAPLYCMPNNAQLGQLAEMIYNYINEHPDSLNISAAQIIHDALGEAFPCQGIKPSKMSHP